MQFQRIVIAGADLAEALKAERAAKIELTPRGYASEQLCELQKKIAGRGIVEAEIVQSNYGYSVRYASGLQDFGLIRPSRGLPEAERTLEAAEAFCREWVAADPARRFATRTVTRTVTIEEGAN